MRTRIVRPVAGLLFVGVLAFACTSEPSVRETATAAGMDGTRARSPGSATPRALTAQVRFVNAMPGSPALEILAESLPLFGNVVFGAVSPYKDVANERVRFALRTAANQTPRALRSETMLARMRYTIGALPDRAGGMSLRVIRDDPVPQRPSRADRSFAADDQEHCVHGGHGLHADPDGAVRAGNRRNHLCGYRLRCS